MRRTRGVLRWRRFQSVLGVDLAFAFQRIFLFLHHVMLRGAINVAWRNMRSLDVTSVGFEVVYLGFDHGGNGVMGALNFGGQEFRFQRGMIIWMRSDGHGGGIGGRWGGGDRRRVGGVINIA